MPVSKRKALRIVGGQEIEQPKFEAGIIECLAIKRFLDFAIADVKYQFDQMNREPSHNRTELAASQAAAVMLSNYLTGLKDGIDFMTNRAQQIGETA